ncbi:MAG TPA: oligosaccharide flippase family protein [Gemmatimonadales bacterium]|nr:oligosaccharide flippase family protein [Gemmatimonadales bacterium]
MSAAAAPTQQAGPPRGIAPPRSTFRRIALYGAARAAIAGVLAIRGLVLATLLGPAAFGGWALIRLGLGYAGFAALGIHRGLELELTRARGRFETGAARDGPARAALGYVLVVFGAIAAVALAASFAVTEPERAFELRAFAAAVLAEQLYVYGLIALRVQANLRRYAGLEFAHAVLQLVCTLGLAVRWGLDGALVGLVIGNVLSLGLLPGMVPLRPAFDVASVRRLLSVGVPFAIALGLARLLSSVDRLTVVTLGGRVMLGYYAFAVAVAGLAAAVGWVIRTVVFPEVYHRMETAGAARAVREHVERSILPFVQLFPPILGLGALALRPALALLAPRYAPAAPAGELFIFSGVAAGLASLGAVGLVAAERQRVLPVFAGAGTALNLVLSLTALRLGLGLEAVAAGALLSQTAYGGAVLVVNLKSAEGSPGAAAARATACRAVLPLAWCAVSVLAVRRVWPGADVSSTALAAAAYLVLLVPLVPRLAAAARRAMIRGGMARGAMLRDAPAPRAAPRAGAGDVV